MPSTTCTAIPLQEQQIRGLRTKDNLVKGNSNIIFLFLLNCNSLFPKQISNFTTYMSAYQEQHK